MPRKYDFSLFADSKSEVYGERSQISRTVAPATIKRFVAASAIISLFALGLQQPVYANALDILQEKVICSFDAHPMSSLFFFSSIYSMTRCDE